MRLLYGENDGYVDLDVSSVETRHGDQFYTGVITATGGSPEKVVLCSPGRVGEAVTIQAVPPMVRASTPTTPTSLRSNGLTRRVGFMRYNPAFKKPKRVKDENGIERFFVNDKKWFTTAEKAKAWIAENKDKPEKPPKVEKADKPEKPKGPFRIPDELWPTALMGAKWRGHSYPSVAHALVASIDNPDAVGVRRLRSLSPFEVAPRRKKEPKGWDKASVYAEILVDYVKNEQVRKALLSTGSKPLHFADPLYGETLMEIREILKTRPLRRI